MKQNIVMFFLVVFCLVPARLVKAIEPISWENNYATAYVKALKEKKKLFVEFYSSKSEPTAPLFNAESASHHVFVKTPYDDSESSTRLRMHEAFRDLSTWNGWVIVDFSDPTTKTFQRTVSVMPGHKMTRKNFDILLRLPEGTLTQRSLIWAIRQHPYAPQSTTGVWRTDFLPYAESWVAEMARSRYQRHGDSPGNAGEIVAEAFPGKSSDVTEGAEELLATWGSAYDYQYSGHWKKVLSGWDGYAYDMAFEPFTATWYAVGVFDGQEYNRGALVPAPRGTNLKQIIRQ